MNLPTLMFRMHANDDPEITCVICYPSNRKPCEYFFALRGSGRVSGIGVHKACVEQAMQRNQVHDEQLERERDEARLMRDRIAAERDQAWAEVEKSVLSLKLFHEQRDRIEKTERERDDARRAFDLANASFLKTCDERDKAVERAKALEEAHAKGPDFLGRRLHFEAMELQRETLALLDAECDRADKAEKALAAAQEIGCVRSDHKHLEGLNREPEAREMDAYFERVRADVATWPKWKREAFQYVTSKDIDDTDPGEHAILPVDSDETER